MKIQVTVENSLLLAIATLSDAEPETIEQIKGFDEDKVVELNLNELMPASEAKQLNMGLGALALGKLELS